MINLTKLLAVFFFISYNSAFSQTDTIPDSIPQKDIYGFFVVDKIWVDKNSAYKRATIGAVNFIQILNGEIYVMTRSSKNSIGYYGGIDSLDVTENESGKSLMFYSHQYNIKTTTRFHNIEITQNKDYSITGHYYCRPTLDGFFFAMHPASDAEINEMEKYFATRPWKFY